MCACVWTANTHSYIMGLMSSHCSNTMAVRRADDDITGRVREKEEFSAFVSLSVDTGRSSLVCWARCSVLYSVIHPSTICQPPCMMTHTHMQIMEIQANISSPYERPQGDDEAASSSSSRSVCPAGFKLRRVSETQAVGEEASQTQNI